MKAFLLCAFVIAVFATVDNAILNPGYVVNFVTPKNDIDSAFVMIPVVGTHNNYNSNKTVNESLNLYCKVVVSTLNVYYPVEEIFIAALAPKTNFTGAVLATDADNAANAAIIWPNVTDNYYYISAQSNCNNGPSGLDTCKSNVDAEVSCWLQYSDGVSQFPYQLINQRRTAKFTIDPLHWIYYVLVITNDLLDSNGSFNLYLGAQLFQDNSGGVQMFVNYPSAGYPTGSGDSSHGVAAAYFPDSPLAGGWISGPLPLQVGVYYVGATSTGKTSYFTNKVGFNQPPTQAANLNASFSRFGLLAVVFLGILITANALKQF